VLSVESVLDEVGVLHLVECPVCVVLHSRCEDDQLIMLVHDPQELLGPRPDPELTSAVVPLLKMHQGLIQVKHKRVLLALLNPLLDEGRFHLGQLGVDAHAQLGALRTDAAGVVGLQGLAHQVFGGGEGVGGQVEQYVFGE